MYIMRGKIYQRLTGSDYSGEWTKNRLSVDGWQQFNHLEFLVMWLRHAKVEVVGEETVGGRDSFVLRLHPSTPDFWPILLREGGSVPLVRDGKLDPVQRDFIKSATATWWVDKQTFAFTRMRVAIGLEWREAQRSASGPATQLSRQPVPQGEFGKVPSGKDWAIDTVIEFHPRAYNQPVMVVLPPEAWQAIEGLVFPLR
ncbi:MAG: hypothetical protein HY330_02935 [Chloroflexi bacterium]|nr:hypothetical protein [Chloroflexota bacterium]